MLSFQKSFFLDQSHNGSRAHHSHNGHMVGEFMGNQTTAEQHFTLIYTLGQLSICSYVHVSGQWEEAQEPGVEFM